MGQPIPPGEEGSVVDVEAGKQGDVGAAHADGVVERPAGPVPSTGAVAVEAEAEGDDGDGEQVGVFVPADDGHDGGGGEDAGQRPQVDAAGTRVAAGSFRGGGGERAARRRRSARTATCSTSAAAKTGPASGIGRPKISPLSIVPHCTSWPRTQPGAVTGIRAAWRRMTMLQTMRIRLAPIAITASGRVGRRTRRRW